ncbi:MAG: AAA family ATPase [Thermodesulfovibrionales bacterium]
MIKKEILEEVIRDFHKETQPENRKRDLIVPLSTDKIITLSGLNRNGKTYMLFEIMKILPSAGICKERMLYINFEDERLNLKQRKCLCDYFFRRRYFC